MTVLLRDGPDDATHRLVLAHGAGAPMDSDFMNDMAALLAARGVHVVRFEFPYMAERRETGKKRPPNSQATLLATWRSVVAELGDTNTLAIGGKSMGGRMASMIADKLGVRALVCLGYPFHPPNQSAKLRTEHLRDLTTRSLIVQGERDSLGKPEEVASYDLSARIEIAWVPDGDHSLKPRVKSGRTLPQNLELAADTIATFLQG